MATQEPVIELEQVTVQYQGHTALEDISLRVPPGQFLAIIGPNGAGKTTLLKAILGLIRPDRGRVRVFGKPPQRLGKDRARIGYVPQRTTGNEHFPVRVREVVMMGRYGRVGVLHRASDADTQAVQRALQRVGIEHLAEEPIAHLSGGQRQRMFVARALANDPELLLLDEPTTGVDIGATESFYALLRQLWEEGITIVTVSHDVGVVAEYADAVACINRTLALHGRPEVVKSGTVLSCLYGPEAAYLQHGPVPHMVVREHAEEEGEGERGE